MEGAWVSSLYSSILYCMYLQMQKNRHTCQCGTFMQVFSQEMTGMDKYESCEREAGPFQGCHNLCEVDEQDLSVLNRGN